MVPIPLSTPCSDTPFAQFELCRAYIEGRHADGWKALARHYHDQKLCGGGTYRPAFQLLLREVEAGGVDRIVVHKMSCFAPSLGELSSTMMILDYGRCSLVAAAQGLDSSTPGGRRVVSILSMLAQPETGRRPTRD